MMIKNWLFGIIQSDFTHFKKFLGNILQRYDQNNSIATHLNSKCKNKCVKY